MSYIKSQIKKLYCPHKQSTIKDILNFFKEQNILYNWYIERNDDFDVLYLSWFENKECFEIALTFDKE